MKQRLLQLDGLRFVLICLIVVSHFEFLLESNIFSDFFQHHLQNGRFAVDFFFILSGFGIYYNSQEKEIGFSVKESVVYAIKKMRKIYPVYLFSLVFGLIHQISATVGSSSHLGRFILEIIAFLFGCLSLTQSLTGMRLFSHAINGVGWFLSSLFICYMLCPLFIHCVKKLKTSCLTYIGLLLTFVALVCLSTIFSKIDNAGFFGGRINDLHYGHPLLRCFYLLLGMCLCNLQGLVKTNFCRIGEHTAFVLYLVWFAIRNVFPYSVLILLVDICVTSLLIYYLAVGTGVFSWILSKNFIVKLGNDAMYIFLIHYPVRMIVGDLCVYFRLTNLVGEWSYVVQVGAIIFITIVLVFFCKRAHKKATRANDLFFDYVINKFSKHT